MHIAKIFKFMRYGAVYDDDFFDGQKNIQVLFIFLKLKYFLYSCQPNAVNYPAAPGPGHMPFSPMLNRAIK